MSKVCAKHIESPAYIYGECIGCELEMLRAEAKALREEVADARRNAEQHELRANQYSEELAALRARVVVVPERLGTTTSKGLMDVMTLHHHLGWNACLDELSRLNGKAVSEGLLRRLYQGWCKAKDTADLADSMEELGALLCEGKEVGDA